jgi:hypothetical protein
MSDTPTPNECPRCEDTQDRFGRSEEPKTPCPDCASTEQTDPRFIRYTIARTVIDGPAIPRGTEVALRLFAVVAPDHIGTETGELIPITKLVIRDWYGPVVERHNPPGDPVDAALEVLAEYVTLPYGGRRLVDDAGSPERVRGDARNREMVRRMMAAYDEARERPQHDRPAQMSEPPTTEESAK